MPDPDDRALAQAYCLAIPLDPAVALPLGLALAYVAMKELEEPAK